MLKTGQAGWMGRLVNLLGSAEKVSAVPAARRYRCGRAPLPLARQESEQCSSRWGTTHHHPKTEIVATVVRTVVVAGGRAGVAPSVVPRAAAHDAIFFLLVIGFCPLPHIAGHIDTAIGAVSLR